MTRSLNLQGEVLMATFEGNGMTGWTITFTIDETHDIADAADVVGKICGLISLAPINPALFRILSAGAGLLSISASRAARNNQAMGIKVRPLLSQKFTDIVLPIKIFYHNG